MAREGYIKGNYATAAAPSEKGQMGSAHYLSRDAGQQAEKGSGKHLSDTHFQGILSKNASDGKVPWTAMNITRFLSPPFKSVKSCSAAKNFTL